ncbi:DUF2842 domain-containing protein [Pseudogemmobacter sonorensis]|uniref:DUF2842 domain-containing protein n=1 Tax=Pseudogemmobacter sonorensis TaxID=2989681 RepID=UPI0036B0F0F2
MALGYKARKRLALAILTLGLPAYVVAVVTVIDLANARWGRMPLWGEFLVFVGLGILWALPLRHVFKGIGQPDPDGDDGSDGGGDGGNGDGGERP